MATYNVNDRMTLLETMKRIGPDGDLLTIAEVLHETNEMFEDAVFVEANAKYSHMTLQRNSLPTGEARDFNDGVSPATSATEKQEDVIMMLEGYSEVDKKLADASGNPMKMRQQEAEAFIEGMGQTVVENILYGNHATDTKEMTGLAARMATIDSHTVWGNGGTGSDVTSAYIVEWGERKVYLAYMPGSMAGISRRDLGEDTKVLSTGKQFQIYREHFSIDFGLVVERPDCIARIANIETAGTSNTFNEDPFIKALFKMYNKGKNAAIYVNDTLYAQMVIRAKDKANVNLFWSDAFGGDTLTLLGRPIRMVDQILNTETAIS